VTRKCWARPASPDIVERFPHARQVVRIITTSQKRRPEAKEREREEHYYLVTGKKGQRRLEAKTLAAIIRKHWGIENRLHHVLDRTLREDDQKTRVGKGALILSFLRKCALALLKTGLPKRKENEYLPEIQARLSARPKKAAALLKAA